MASNADDSLTTELTLTDYATDGPSSHSGDTGQLKASSVHEHTRQRLANEEESLPNGRRLLYCKYCTTYSSSVTTNFRLHLLRKHQVSNEPHKASTKVVAADRLLQIWNEALNDGNRRTAKDLESLVLQKVVRREACRRAVIELIVVGNLPFRIVEMPQFHTFCASLNPVALDFLPTSHSTVASILHNLFQESQDTVRKRLQSALSDIHLSIDIWTSPNNYLFLAVCAHFVDNNEQPRKALLALSNVSGHSGDNQWDALLPVLKDYGISHKIGAVIADNSSTNDTLCRYMSHYFKEQEGTDWDPIARRIRCHGHILNLAVQAFLFDGCIQVPVIESYEEGERRGEFQTETERREKTKAFRTMGVLGRLHNIIAHSRSSAARTAQFLEHVARRIPLDNRTRWNSWYNLLNIALEREAGINEYVKLNLDSLSNDSLSPRDWVSLRTLHQFLEPFHRATLDTQGDNTRLDRVLFSMDVLLKHIEASLTQFKQSKDLTARIQLCWEKYTSYYERTEESPLYVTALILHPSRRLAYIKKWWEAEWQQPAIDSARKLWQDYRDKHPIPCSTLSPDQADNCVADETTESQKLSVYDRIKQDMENDLCLSLQEPGPDEFDDYASACPSALHSGMTPLAWWRQDVQRVRWPILSRFAMNVLCIPAMSDEPERVFSGGRRTISWERMSLGPDSVQRVECLKSWFRSGIVQHRVD